MLGEHPTRWRLGWGVAGVIGVAMMVLRGEVALETVGLAAGLAATAAMSTGVVLTKLWGRPVGVLAFTGWQLTAGGLFLMPLALIRRVRPRARRNRRRTNEPRRVHARSTTPVASAVATRSATPRSRARPRTRPAHRYQEMRTMRIAVVGATGAVGTRVVAEAIDRGHAVTAVARTPGRMAELPDAATPRSPTHPTSTPSPISAEVRTW